MESRKWTNRGQPQTLQIAVFLLYANAFFLGLFLLTAPSQFGRPLFAGSLAGMVAAGWGVANERKWGYALGIAMAFLPFALRFYYSNYRVSAIFSVDPISLMFEIALVALLLHPQSKDYQRIWFK